MKLLCVSGFQTLFLNQYLCLNCFVVYWEWERSLHLGMKLFECNEERQNGVVVLVLDLRHGSPRLTFLISHRASWVSLGSEYHPIHIYSNCVQ